MKLSREQKANIGVLVLNEVQFHETSLEVYDHMITSMELRDALPDLQKAYAEILEEDFGGHKGIEQSEQGRRTALLGYVSKQKQTILKRLFTFPGILIPVCLGFAYYYGFHFNNFRLWLFLGSGVMIFLPLVLIIIGNFFIRLTTGVSKRSIQNIGIGLMVKRIWKIYAFLLVLRIINNIILPKNVYRIDFATSVITGDIFTGTTFALALFYAIVTLAAYSTEFKSRLAL